MNEPRRVFDRHSADQVMRFSCTTRLEKKRQRLARLVNWHKWFAWHPAPINNGQYVWLEIVERRYPDAWLGDISGTIWLCCLVEYRLDLQRTIGDPAMIKSPLIRPTVGRVVLFHLGDATPSLEWNASPDGSNTYAALVTYVHNDRMINLSAFDANGIQEGFTSVPLIQDGAAPADGYWCEWMPYQKQVASGQIPPTLHAAPPEAAVPADKDDSSDLSF